MRNRGDADIVESISLERRLDDLEDQLLRQIEKAASGKVTPSAARAQARLVNAYARLYRVRREGR